MISESVRSKGNAIVVPSILVAASAAIWFLTIGSEAAKVVRGLTIPILLAAAATIAFRPRFFAVFSDDAIDVHHPIRRCIKFADIVAIQTLRNFAGTSRRLKRPDALVLYHDRGWCLIPASLDQPLAAVIEFIAARIGFGGSHNVNDRLIEFRDTQEASFGSDRVHCFVSREMPSPRYGHRWLIFGTVLVAFAALLPCLGTGDWSASDFVGLFLIGPIGVIIAICAAARRSKVPKVLRKSGLVIGPSGLALAQGSVVGELEWRELKDIRHRSMAATRGSVQLTHGLTGLILRVEGAEIGIADIYDRPTIVIERLIRLFWQGTATCGACNATLTFESGPVCNNCQGSLGTGLIRAAS